MNRVISLLERIVLRGLSFVAVTRSRRHNDRPLRRLLFAVNLVRLVTLLTLLLLPRPTFQSKAIDEVANSRRLTIAWITGENSPNYT